MRAQGVRGSILNIGFFDGFGPPDDFALDVVSELGGCVVDHRIKALFVHFCFDIVCFHQRIGFFVELIDDGRWGVDGRKKSEPIADLKSCESR